MSADTVLVEGRPYNSEQFAVIKAKASPSRAAAESSANAASPATNGHDEKLDTNTAQAFRQLFMYMRQIYTNQNDHHFMWGITACDTRVRACILTSGGVLASHKMDASTATGCSEYIQLLVDWSMCDWHQLGFDPSVRWLEDLDCWEIDVPSTASASE
ncbi:hypothetical protein H4S06_005819, partial [Coemansia sp. BCRC 34490]